MHKPTKYTKLYARTVLNRSSAVPNPSRTLATVSCVRSSHHETLDYGEVVVVTVSVPVAVVLASEVAVTVTVTASVSEELLEIEMSVAELKPDEITTVEVMTLMEVVLTVVVAVVLVVKVEEVSPSSHGIHMEEEEDDDTVGAG
ncbi:hypothetical protein M501DRAFT_989926 [Patellaria atrata CBS 101060]|uniref:Uncharacterized protein n=1 Tax=Patellaria atrata CBS 101060 TaxID=1346257 RepID=A0A9P4SF56_9PEZI|nr:hypothetical protein M501DRAFT_989926 [Patellaria atrata CBS 101060]